METSVSEQAGILAEAYKKKGFKCAESVILAMAEVQGIESDLLTKIGTVFSSGMSQTCGTCGALTGAVMGIGIALGRTETDQSAGPSQKATKQLITEFEQEFGAKDCHMLLGFDIGTKEGLALLKTPKSKEQCTGYTRRAAEIATAIIENTKK